MAGHDPTEHIQEEIHHHAAHGEGGPRWIAWAALLAAIVAALAAVTGALASARLTEATHQRIAANDLWAEFQANSVKEKVLISKLAILEKLGEKRDAEDEADVAKYKKRYAKVAGEKSIETRAKKAEHLAEHALETHETLERAVTFFHISIAIVAVAVLSKLRPFFFTALATGAIGLYFAAHGGLLHLKGPHTAPPHHGATTQAVQQHGQAKPAAGH